jgi:hypothetical protein
MSLNASLSALFGRVSKLKQVRSKAAWAMQSQIDFLADNLPRDRESWVIDHNAIRLNGVVIAWNGPLSASETSVSVKMDGARFRVTPDENKKLKARLTEFMEAHAMGAT